MLTVAILDSDAQFVERIGEYLTHDARFGRPKLLTDPQKAVLYVKRASPNVFLVDINLDNGNGVKWIHRLRETNSTPRILAFTTQHQESMVIKALEAGAQGYILKGDTLPRVADAIAEAVSGQPVVSKPVLKIIINYLQRNVNQEVPSSMSRAETRVLQLTKLGYDCKTIADKLNISVQTVYVHNRRIFRKLGVNSRMAAVARLQETPMEPQTALAE
jgi:DNA-binding NarL/FixJ family response regulator